MNGQKDERKGKNYIPLSYNDGYTKSNYGYPKKIAIILDIKKLIFGYP